MTTRLLLGLLLVGHVVLAAGPELELTGVMQGDGPTRLAFRDLRTGTSRWIEVGASVGGYTVTNYNPKDGSVVLTKGSESTKLVLKESRPPNPASDEAQIAAFEDAIRRAPGSGELELQFGHFLRERGRSGEAFVHFLAALRKGNLERPWAVHSLVAYSGYELEEYDAVLKSIAELEKSEEGRKDSQLPHLKRATLNLREQAARKAKAKAP